MKLIIFTALLALLSLSSKSQDTFTSLPTTQGYIDIPNLKWTSKDTIITGDRDLIIKQLMSLVQKIGDQKELSDYMLMLPSSINFKTTLDKIKYEHAQKLWRANKGFDFDYFNTKPYFTYKTKKHDTN